MNKEEIKSQLQSVLESDYPGIDTFIEKVINLIFKGDDAYQPLPARVDILQGKDRTIIEDSNIQQVYLYGEVDTFVPIKVYDITIKDNANIGISRVGIQKFVRQHIAPESQAFMLFHYENPLNRSWRFSYLYKEISQTDSTNAKRYTYLFGKNYHARTAIERFSMLVGKEMINAQPLLDAFSVQQLSDDFFDEYKEHYLDFIQYITGKRNLKVSNEWKDVPVCEPNEEFYAAFNHEDKRVRDYVKKMMGRLVFLCFLQRKGWMGNGDMQYLQNLYRNSSDTVKKDFLDKVLEPMFFGLLNTKPEERHDKFNNEGWDLNLIKYADNIPYLNGGLFEQDKDDAERSVFPCELFSNPNASEEEKKYGKSTVYDYTKKRGLLDFFSAYNFTIDENDPDDAEVGVDPEMLGRIFENLLEDNKDKGAFYTPKEIVRYMCKESLIAYLQTNIEEEVKKNAIRHFVEEHKASYIEEIGTDLVASISKSLQNVKICDPAIGSGAFPMGLLNELVRCRTSIGAWAKDIDGRPLIDDYAALKTEIICNNIYGVDLEKGAVDIARLRFWLSLVVDEKVPKPLPNLDFKIMQGNSLLEQYAGIDLSKLSSLKNDVKIVEPERDLFGNIVDGQMKFTFTNSDIALNLQTNITNYFDTSNCNTDKSTLRKNVEDSVRDLIKFNIECKMSHAERDIREISYTPENNKTTKQIKALEEAQKEYEHYQSVLTKVETLPMQNSEFFLWHTWFADVFKKGGFDIVIGNPPYVSLEVLPDEVVTLYKNQHYHTFASRADLYCLFYELGCKSLNEGGHLCYITSNKWMCSGYGKRLREYFLSYTNPILLVDFAGTKVFNSATVDTNIILISKGIYQNLTKCVSLLKFKKEDFGELGNYIYKNAVENSFCNSESWSILSKKETIIKRKIETIGVPLGQCNIEINWGIRTGFNDAFILDKETREYILKSCSSKEEKNRTERIILPILRGRDIRNQTYIWSGLYVIGAYNGIYKIMQDKYPAIYNHLCKFETELKKRGQVIQTASKKKNIQKDYPGQHHWLELDNNPSLERINDCYRKKIIYPDITQSMCFVVSEPGYAVTNTAYYITGECNYEALCIVLNSYLIHWYYKTLSVQLGEAAMRMFTQYVLQIPIPKNIGLLNSINAEDRELAVYHLYNLTYDEVLVIDPSTPITREEYESFDINNL